MTLRLRLLFVYLIVVLLSAATVGVALFELDRSLQIIRELQDWQGIVAKLESFRAAFRPPQPLRLAIHPAEGLDRGEVSAALRAQLAEAGLRVSPQAAASALEPGRRWVVHDDAQQYSIVMTSDVLLVYPPPTTETQEDVDFASLFPRQYIELNRAPAYLDVERLRDALRDAQLQYRTWVQLEPEQRAANTGAVVRSLDQLKRIVEWEFNKLNWEADKQNVRKRILLAVVIALVVVHMSVIGSLLRRWLLWPMERLNRQVEALARDEPPAEPLLAEPLEMARLAQALDRARRSLADYRRQLIEAERLTTIGQFAAQLAHNLRNPLASIRAAAQVAGRHEQDRAYVRQRLGEIVVSVDRLSRWVAGLTEIARRELRPPRSADVTPVLHRVCEAVAPEIQAKELTLHLDAPGEGIVCSHDPDTLEQALVAMVINAIEASPVGGRIDLAACRVGGPAHNGALCRISVADHGPGLPENDPDCIFESWFSTKQQGMGLGLALAREALKRQGGSAHARNNPDGGATVYVELPIENEAGREN